MLKKLVLVSIIFFCLLGACSSRGAGFQDGYYSAIAETFDSHGWKEFITICVNSGIITTVEYNAVNQSGFVKSWDMEYMRTMKAVSGSYPNEYTRRYAGDLIVNQGNGDVDALTGATDSWSSFNQLAAAVLDHARRGDTSMALVLIVPYHSAVAGGGAGE
jgi:major membrane immunogen (membrane-anchored lipoprotein)